MKKFTLLTALFLMLACTYSFGQDQITQQTDSTTFIFVRHAEKMDDGTKDPMLNEMGKQRAILLADTLKDYVISAIYSTSYKRTSMTAQPLAEQNGLEIMNYGFDDPPGLLKSMLETNSGSVVLIVGHSNTTPYLVNLMLGEKKFEQLSENAYGDIFVVKASEIGKAHVTHFTY